MGALQNDKQYLEFIAWTALPPGLRKPSSQRKLAKRLGVHETTLSDWKRRDDFWDLVRSFIKDWARTKTPEVVQAVFEGATMVGESGQAANAKLWLQYIEDWAERQHISIYDKEKEGRAKSLLDVYRANLDGDKNTNNKTAKRGATSKG